jgi:hypothetical protein
VSGNNLFVTNQRNGTVGQYNAITGAAINANFISGLSGINGLAATPILAPTPTATPTPTPSPTRHIAKDFDGDGFADLVWENTSTGQRSIWFLKNGVRANTTNLPTTPVAWRIERKRVTKL